MHIHIYIYNIIYLYIYHSEHAKLAAEKGEKWLLHDEEGKRLVELVHTEYIKVLALLLLLLPLLLLQDEEGKRLVEPFFLSFFLFNQELQRVYDTYQCMRP